jgi:hypothetical protein
MQVFISEQGAARQAALRVRGTTNTFKVERHSQINADRTGDMGFKVKLFSERGAFLGVL